jgi:hypothetical protein
MAYAPVSDSFHCHPKVLALGENNLDALGLWILALTWSTRLLTDGFVPFDVPKILIKEVHHHTRKRMIRALVRVGLWDVVTAQRTSNASDTPPIRLRYASARQLQRRRKEVTRLLNDPNIDVDDVIGYQIHDFLDWQKSGEEIRELRHKRRIAGSLGGKRSGEARASKSQPNAKANSKQMLPLSEANANPLHYTPKREKGSTLVGGKTIRGGATLTDAGAPPTGTEGRPPRLVTPNVAELFLSLQASETSEDEQHSKAATLAEYQAYLERNGLTPGQEGC